MFIDFKETGVNVSPQWVLSSSRSLVGQSLCDIHEEELETVGGVGSSAFKTANYRAKLERR